MSITSRKGLSDIVTTVLIILLAIAAVIIVWAFVRNLIQQGTQGASADCLKLELESTSCRVTDVFDTSVPPVDIGDKYAVNYFWAGGEILGNLSGLKVVIEDSDGDREVIESASDDKLPGKVLENGDIEGDLATGSSVQKANGPTVAIVPIITGSDGQVVTCREVAKVPCS